MLYEFLTSQRTAILNVAREKASGIMGGSANHGTVEEGWKVFYDELIGILKLDQPFEFHSERGAHSSMAVKQGKEYVRLGCTISEVVHSYGNICQAITEVATDRGYQMTPREFRQLNLSLDTAIAEAVSEFERVRRATVRLAEIDRLGVLSDELRNCLQTATIALDIVESGTVGVGSHTSSILRNSLNTMSTLLDTSMTGIRLAADPEVSLERVRLFDLMSEVGVMSDHPSRSRGIIVEIQGDLSLEVAVDRHLFTSALSNLVTRALKNARRGDTIYVRGHSYDNRILIDVEGACDTDSVVPSTGTGGAFSLDLVQRAVERNAGTLEVRQTDSGCVTTIALPKPDAEQLRGQGDGARGLGQ